MPPDRHKYFFDLHNFDQEKRPEPEPDLPPPPPSFSLEDLASAREESFAAGRLVGIEEEKASRGDYVARQLDVLGETIRGLVLSEQRRENLFEQEVVTLCAAIFGKAFPLMNDTYGLSEVYGIVQKVVASCPPTPISIEVPEADVKELGDILAEDAGLPFGRILLKPCPSLERGSCRITWENGGALRDHAAIALEIARQLEEILAPKKQKGDNTKPKGDTDHG